MVEDAKRLIGEAVGRRERRAIGENIRLENKISRVEDPTRGQITSKVGSLIVDAEVNSGASTVRALGPLRLVEDGEA